MSSTDTRPETCPDCYLPLAICICHPVPVYDPVARREEILGRLDDLQGLIDEALKVGDIKPVNPFSEGHGDSTPVADDAAAISAPITNP